MFIISNSFSINMLKDDITLQFSRTTGSIVPELLKLGSWKSIIGHADMAGIVSIELGMEIPMNRESYTFQESGASNNPFSEDDAQIWGSDILIVAQYSGPRLPEGCSELPGGANIQYWIVAEKAHPVFNREQKIWHDMMSDE